MPSPTASYEPPPLSAAPSESDDSEGFLVLCLYDFDSQDHDQLSFRRGDVLRIVQTQDTGWWAAIDPTETTVGWVPQEFVQRMSDEMLYTLAVNEQETARAAQFDVEHDTSQQDIDSSLLVPDDDGHTQPSAPISPAHRHHPFRLSRIPGTRRASVQMTTLSEIHAIVPPSPRMPVPQPMPSPQTAPLYAPSYYRDEPSVSLIEDRSDRRAADRSQSSRPLPANSQSRSQTAPSLPLLINKPVPPTPDASGDAPGLSRSVSESASITSASSATRARRRRPTPLVANDEITLNRISLAVDGVSRADSSSQRSESPAQLFERRQGARPSFDELSVDTSAGSMSDSTSASASSSRLNADAKEMTARMNILQAQARLPWYLQPSYVEGEDIVLESDGSVKGGNIMALVERLAMDPGNFNDAKAFRRAFLATFKSFVTAEVLFELLEERYRMDHPPELDDQQFDEWRQKKQKPAQTRILVVMREWLEDHNMLQEDPQIAPKLREFLMLVKSPPAQALTAKQTLQSLDRLQSTPPRDPYEAISRSRPGRRANKSLGTDILKIDPTLLAQQLTLLEARLYSHVRPSECLAYGRVGNINNGVMTLKNGDKNSGLPLVSTQNLIAFCATNDKLASWVKMSVLERDGLGKRADTIDHWLKVAEKCRALQNISSTSAIIAALSSVDIRQLNLTWAHVGRTTQYQHLARLTDPAANFGVCRATLSKLQGPCVPFIGMYLSELIHYSDRFDDYLTASGSATTSVMSVPFALSPNQSHTVQSPAPMTTLGSAFSPMQQQIAGVSRVIGAAPPGSYPSASASAKSPFSAQAGTPMSANVKNGVEARGPLPLINFVKRQYIATVMDSILRHQAYTYDIAEEQHLYAYIESRLQLAASKDQGTFWLRSQDVQQAEIAHADIRRGLEQAGF